MSLLIYVTFMTAIPTLKYVLQWKYMKAVCCLLTDEFSLVAKENNVLWCLTSCSVVEI